jgi:predicted nucleic acid-binding protein
MGLTLRQFEIPGKMILVDTSIWIEFFKSNPAFVDEMESLLEDKNVITIEPVFAELLYGSINDNERNVIFSYWKVLPKIKFGEGSFIESAAFANKRNYHNAGIGLIDSILSKAVTDNKCLIWTLDKKILNKLDVKLLYNSHK